MISTPFFSIIIPAYNVGKYIGKTLESLENQKYKQFEVLIIDDGSTDNTVDIVTAIKKKGSLNIEILTQNNLGVSVARNRGLECSIGKYVYFLDGDDIVSNNLFCSLRKVIKKSADRDVIIFNYSLIDENYKVIAEEKSDLVSIIQKMKKDREQLILSYLNIYGNIGLNSIRVSSIIYRREFLEENSLVFYPGCTMGEDNEFIIKALLNAKKIIHVSEILFYYLVKRSDSAMRNLSLKHFDEIQSLFRLRDYFVRMGFLKKNLSEFDNKIIPSHFFHNYFKVVRSIYGYKSFRELNHKICEHLKIDSETLLGYEDKYCTNIYCSCRGIKRIRKHIELKILFSNIFICRIYLKIKIVYRALLCDITY